jgi:hypothetical protein
LYLYRNCLCLICIYYFILTFPFVISILVFLKWKSYEILRIYRLRRGRDHMVVGLTCTCAISTYHHYRCEFESHWGEVYSIHHYVTYGKFVGFSGTPVSSTNKTDCHDIIEILLKVALNIIIQAKSKNSKSTYIGKKIWCQEFFLFTSTYLQVI